MLTDRSRNALATSSAIALATALAAVSQQAHAQAAAPNPSFLGTAPASSNYTIIQGTGATPSTSITINAPQAVIDWTPTETTISNGTPLIFQQAGTATFARADQNFAVLNRIIPTDATRPVQFNGTVNSQIFFTAVIASVPPVQAGSVYFYSPAGVIVGPTGAFNVGSLVLTTADPLVSGGNFITDFGGSNQVQFQQANAGSFVALQNGAQVNALDLGAFSSYVGLVAPRVSNAGAINVEGSAALVSADAATINFNVNGLFDIQVDSGTSSTGIGGDGVTLFNSGSIGGSAGDPGASHRAYLVAVPKNTAITMAIASGSTLGFDIADAADVQGNAVILSGGHDIDGSSGEPETVRSAGAGTGATLIQSGSTTANIALTSDVRARSDGDISILAGNSTTSFAAGLRAHSDTKVDAFANAGGALSVVGSVDFDATRFGIATSPSATAGNVTLGASNGGTINVGGSVFLEADAFASDSSTAGINGGSATAGTAQLGVFMGGTITVAGEVDIEADAFGGLGLVNGISGGSATAGLAQIYNDTSGTITLNASFGNVNLEADAFGGDGSFTAGGNGGSATAGQARAILYNSTAATGSGTLTMNGFSAEADAFGGDGGINGGSATAGTVRLAADAAGKTINVGTFVEMESFASGGFVATGLAGSATAGLTEIAAIGSSVDIGNDVSLDSSASGGSTSDDLIPATAGSATAGIARVTVSAGSTLDIGGSADLRANALGGDSDAGTGGSATGGTSIISTFSSSLTIGADVSIDGEVFGGEGFVGAGGSASGGTANLVASGAGATLAIGGGVQLDVFANAGGSGSSGGNGGAATGGTTGIVAQPGGTVTIADFVEMEAGANGGFAAASGATGGAAQGGTAQLTVLQTGSISIGADTELAADGFGGDGGFGANGGAGRGGIARAFLINNPTTSLGGGSLAISGNLTATADGVGGDAGTCPTCTGAGGAGFGGTTQLFAAAGGKTVDIDGQIEFDANGFGGITMVGAAGAGTGGSSTINPAGDATFNLISVSLDASGFGGNNSGAGAAGNATGGFAQILSAASPTTTGTTTVSGPVELFATAFGGDAAQPGSTGGNATGGSAAIFTTAPLILEDIVSLGTFAVGGNGYNGGNGTGGVVGAVAAAGTGALTINGTLSANASAEGGAGGIGATSTSGAGGVGGIGGNGSGGSIILGTQSEPDTPTTNGSATFGFVSADASGFGGAGGAGGSGTTQGVGGAGGDGDNGFVNLQVFGGTVNFDSAELTANAEGGAGGAGSTAGVGGDGIVGGDGGISVIVSNRINHIDQPGRLNGGDLSIQTDAFGGSGSTTGAALLGDDQTNVFRVVNSTVDVDNISYELLALQVDPGAEPDLIELINSTVDVTGTFQWLTAADLTVNLDNATMNVANLQLNSQGTYVLPATAPTVAGTFNVTGGMGLFSGQDFLTFANFNVAFDTSYAWNGAFRVGNYISTGAFVLTAVGPVTIGNITGTTIDLRSQQAMALGNITSSASIDLLAAQGLTTGNIIASTTLEADAGGNLLLGNITSGQSIRLFALGGPATTVTTGNLTAGITPGTQFSIGIAANGALTTGNIVASGVAGLLSNNSSVTAGNIGAGSLILLNRGAVNLGSVTTPIAPGTFVFIANASMAPLGGALGPTFNPAPILAAPLVATPGPITISGPVATTTFRAGATGSITTGAINVGNNVALNSTGSTVTVGNVQAGAQVTLAGAAGVTAGNIITGSVPTPGVAAIAIGGGTGGIVTGGLISQFDIGLQTPASITTGNIVGRDILLLPGASLTTGSIQAGPTTQPGRLYIGNFSMATPGANVFSPNFQALPIFALDPIAINGPINIAGTVAARDFIAATASTFTLGTGPTAPDINLPGRLNLASGGALALGNVTALDIELDSGGTLTAGNLTSREAIGVTATGAITLGNLSASIVNPTTNPDADRDVGVASTGGALTVGTVAAVQDVGLAAGGGILTAGNISAGDDVLLLGRDGVNVGSITAGTSDGRVYVANASMLSLGGSLDDFNADPIFAATPVPVSGAISFGGPVSGTTFRGASTGNFTAGALTFSQSLQINQAGTAQVNGAWTAPTISVASQRLAFGTDSSAGIGSSSTQTLTLRALPSQQTAVFGGTTQGSGYTLTQSDFARIRAQNLTIQVDPQGASSSAPDMEIRDLTLTGGSSGFASTTFTTTGTARVSGDLLLSNAGSSDTLKVNATNRLEIVLPEGSVAITGAGGGLAGTLTLSSNTIVAATLDLIQQAVADPTAAGLTTSLRTPASTTANLDGYIRANGVMLLSNANILLQNSGTARDFAGVTAGGNGLIIGRITPTSGGSSGGTGGGTGTGTGTGFSFTGMLVTADDVLIFDFTLGGSSTVTLRTFSYAGGTNQAGAVIPAGGFDPILALFDSTGALIGQNDDGGSNVPADPMTGARFDTFFQSSTLPAGNYKVSVSVFSNFANGPNLSNGFEGGGDFDGRTTNFAFDVLGATSASQSSGPPSQPTGPSGPLNVIGFGRQIGADGRPVTNNAFFPLIQTGQGTDTAVEFTDSAQFNTCLFSSGCGGSGVDSDIAGPIATISTEIQLLGLDTLAEEPFIDAAEASFSEAQSEAQAEDSASSPIAPPSSIVDSRQLNADILVVEPVAGSGNPALIGTELTCDPSSPNSPTPCLGNPALIGTTVTPPPTQEKQP